MRDWSTNRLCPVRIEVRRVQAMDEEEEYGTRDGAIVCIWSAPKQCPMLFVQDMLGTRATECGVSPHTVGCQFATSRFPVVD